MASVILTHKPLRLISIIISYWLRLEILVVNNLGDEVPVCSEGMKIIIVYKTCGEIPIFYSIL